MVCSELMENVLKFDKRAKGEHKDGWLNGPDVARVHSLPNLALIPGTFSHTCSVYITHQIKSHNFSLLWTVFSGSTSFHFWKNPPSISKRYSVINRWETVQYKVQSTNSLQLKWDHVQTPGKSCWVLPLQSFLCQSPIQKFGSGFWLNCILRDPSCCYLNETLLFIKRSRHRQMDNVSTCLTWNIQGSYVTASNRLLYALYRNTFSK